jgi:carboxymethylenebutenolidase
MIIAEEHADLDTPSGPMRTHLFLPAGSSPRPGIVLFSEIYQVTGPIRRMARLLAGNGYVVSAPEVYHEFEPPGTVLAYNPADTDKGNRYKIGKPVEAYDADARAAIAHLRAHPACTGRLGAMGVCLGGHLAFRCAMNAEILAAACFYPTDIHKRSLGLGMRDDSLDRIPEIRGEVLMAWGRQDPHIPAEGRDLIRRALADAGTEHTWHEFNAQHAFLRDEGHRYDPGLARVAYALVFELFGRRLA